MKREQPSYYTNIPAFVRYDEELLKKPKSILLYGEIVALSNQKGFCWARNSYFSERLRVSGRMIQDYLDLLVSKGYIARKLIYKPNSKQIDKRILSIASRPSEIDFTRGSETDFMSPREADFADNITSINTTSMNITSNNTTTTTPTKLNNATTAQSGGGQKYSHEDVLNRWQQDWGFPNSYVRQDIDEWIATFGNDLVYYTIEYALSKDVKARSADPFLKAVFENYAAKKVSTIADAERANKEFDSRNAFRQRTGYAYQKPKKRIYD